jgi:hypothetical protein
MKNNLKNLQDFTIKKINKKELVKSKNTFL